MPTTNPVRTGFESSRILRLRFREPIPVFTLTWSPIFSLRVSMESAVAHSGTIVHCPHAMAASAFFPIASVALAHSWHTSMLAVDCRVPTCEGRFPPSYLTAGRKDGWIRPSVLQSSSWLKADASLRCCPSRRAAVPPIAQRQKAGRGRRCRPPFDPDLKRAISINPWPREWQTLRDATIHRHLASVRVGVEIRIHQKRKPMEKLRCPNCGRQSLEVGSRPHRTQFLSGRTNTRRVADNPCPYRKLNPNIVMV
jgi:hypothetical protein